MKNKFKAFTLIELIITVSIIAIIISLVLVNSKVIDSYQEKVEIEQFIIDINYCKSLSLHNRKRNKISLKLKENSYFISSENKKVIFENIEFVESLTNTDNLEFTEGGKPAFNSAGTIYIKSLKTNNLYKITITPVTGKINVSKANNEKN